MIGNFHHDEHATRAALVWCGGFGLQTISLTSFSSSRYHAQYETQLSMLTGLAKFTLPFWRLCQRFGFRQRLTQGLFSDYVTHPVPPGHSPGPGTEGEGAPAVHPVPPLDGRPGEGRGRRGHHHKLLQPCITFT